MTDHTGTSAPDTTPVTTPAVTPAGPDTSGRDAARTELPAALRHDVRLLGDVLGDILREYGGDSLLADVERLRELAIAARAGEADPGSTAAAELAEQAAVGARDLVAGWTATRAADVARAFTVYFHLANLAEEQHRVRTLRERDTDGAVAGGLAAAVHDLGAALGADRATELLAALEFRPVLTAHPTEARRVALTAAIRRIEDLLDAFDDPRAGVGEKAETRRRLAEEVDVLWRADQVRLRRPDPLDEVRTALAVFDETLFTTVPMVYRELDDALQPAVAGTVAPVAPAFIRLGSWIGGDRDGNPNVTAAITRQAMGIQAEHALLALERAAARIGRSLTLSEGTTPGSAELGALLGRARALAPEVIADLVVRSPAEPHRQAVLWLAARIAGTRRRDADLGYTRPEELAADLAVVQESLAAAGAVRQAYGELQHLMWQVETFGFHLAELEVRQHSAVHRRALGELREHGPDSPLLSPMTREVLDTIRVVETIQRRFGPQAARRYVVSFTQSAADLAAVDELAGFALGAGAADFALDVVPLFETGEDLQNCVDILEAALKEPVTTARLERNGRHLEVMLGYSDSAKDVGTTSAALILHDAQARLVAWASRHDIALTLFHGRGGALGRGGGPANRAIIAQAPGSVAGRFKVTEQGEVIFARYGREAIARRHIEQVAAATLQAWLPEHTDRGNRAAAAYGDLTAVLDHASRDAFVALVRADGFADWFAQVTPLDEIALLQIGSRPAKRGLDPGAARSLDDLRAIPWVFSWSQARLNLPGWYGLGSGLAAVGDLDQLRAARAEWPLFTVLLENAEMSLAKADRRIAEGYLALGDRPDLAATVLAEYDRTREWVLAVTEHTRLLEDRRVLGRAVQLRNPYVDALSFLQLRALRGLRAADASGGGGTGGSGGTREDLQQLLLSTVNGVAAGLQNTG